MTVSYPHDFLRKIIRHDKEYMRNNPIHGAEKRREGQGQSNLDGGSHSWVTCFDPCYYSYILRGR